MNYFVYFNELLKNKFTKYYNSKEFVNSYLSILKLENLDDFDLVSLIIAFNSFYYLDTDHYIFEDAYFYEMIYKELNKRKKREFCAI